MKSNKAAAFFQKRGFLITGAIAVLSTVIGILICSAITGLIGINPLLAFRHFMTGVFGSLPGLGEMINKFTPLLCCAMSFAIAQKSGFFTMGGDGQFYAGALFAVLAASHLGSLPAVPAVILTIAFGMLGGALWSGVAGVLKIYLGANEMLTTLMLNYIMSYFVLLLVSGVLKDPKSNMEQTAAVPANTKLPFLTGADARMHAGVLIALGIMLLVLFFYNKTSVGYQMRLLGMNPKCANYAGIPVRRSLFTAIFLSGALAGLGGALELLGNQYKLMGGFSNNFGFDGIAIAVMGQYTPVGMIICTILFASLRVGTSSMQRGANVPLPMLYILQGVILICVLCGNRYVRKLKRAVSVRR